MPLRKKWMKKFISVKSSVYDCYLHKVKNEIVMIFAFSGAFFCEQFTQNFQAKIKCKKVGLL
jgi:hypothetical protein